MLVIAPKGIAATISGSVFDDSTGTVENDFDAGDTPLAGVTVELFQDNDENGEPDGPALDSTTNLGDGSYSFPDLSWGVFIVQETDPVGYISVKDIDGGDPSAGQIVVPIGGVVPVIEEANFTLLTQGAVVGQTNNVTVNGASVDFDIFEVGTARYDRTAVDDASNPSNSEFAFLIQDSQLAAGNAFTNGSPTVSGQTPDDSPLGE